MPDRPEALKEHAAKYKDGAWKNYTLEELGDFVHLFHKRSSHRADLEKRKKDLTDARNYWKMMGAWLDDAESHL